MQLQCFYQGNKHQTHLLTLHIVKNEINVQRFQPLLKKKWGVFFSAQVAHTSALGASLQRGLGVCPPAQFCKFNFSKAALHVHFDTAAVFNIMESLGETMIIGQVNVRQSVLHSDHHKILKISNFAPCFQNFMIDWENVIKIRRTGGNPGDFRTNWEG